MRGSGRDRSEIPDLDRRVNALDQDLGQYSLQRQAQANAAQSDARELFTRAFLFTLEAYAAAVLLRLRAELFERRYEMPNSDVEVFSILQRNEVLDLVEARKLRQFCEARHLSGRDLEKVDSGSIFDALDESLGEVRAVLTRLSSGKRY